LHDRSFDLVLLSNWEDEIVYKPSHTATPSTLEDNNLTTPVNKALESGAWTQSIIWSRNAPFRDFIQLELNEEDIAEEHPQGSPSITLLSRVFLLICGGIQL
jgi:transcription initiation factor TFIID subunit 1